MRFLMLLCLLAQEQPIFRSKVTLIHVDVEVSDAKGLIANLTSGDFRVTDNGKPQPILLFAGEDEALDATLLFDTRGEMRRAVERVAEMARIALRELRPGDRVAVLAFGASNRCLPDLLAPFSSDLDVVERSIAIKVLSRDFSSGGGCSVLRAIDGAAQQFLQEPAGKRRRAIIAITDDKFTGVAPDLVHKTVHDLWGVDAVVLGVVVHTGAVDVWIGPPNRGAGYVAGQTGGDIVNSADAPEGLRESIHRLRSRYSIYYALPTAKPGEERKIRLQLTGEAAKRYPRATIRARTGYVVPGEAPPAAFEK
jgi:hypothetical protein